MRNPVVQIALDIRQVEADEFRKVIDHGTGWVRRCQRSVGSPLTTDETIGRVSLEIVVGYYLIPKAEIAAMET